MAKDYEMKFGTGDPRPFTGLTPTMILFFVAKTGVTLPPPGISEIFAGTGFYYFTYGTTQAIAFTADGGAALSAGDRYVSGVLDPIQAIDQQIGYSTDSVGSTSVDPTTLWGVNRRQIEHLEGDAVFTKSTGVWQIYNRTSLGSTTLLRTKTLTNTTTSATKTGV